MGFDFHSIGQFSVNLSLGIVGTELCVDNGIDGSFGDWRDLHPILEGVVGHRAGSDERAVTALKVKELALIFVEQDKLTRNAVVGLPRCGSPACV